MTLTETLLEEPRCRPARRTAATTSGRGAHDIVTPIPDSFRLQSGERLGQRSIVGRLHGRAGAPLVIVAGGMGEANHQWLQAWRRWPQLQAVRNAQLHFIPPSLLQRHTPRLLEGTERLCKALDEARRVQAPPP